MLRLNNNIKKGLLIFLTIFFVISLSGINKINTKAEEISKKNTTKNLGETVLNVYDTDGTTIKGTEGELIKQAFDKKVKYQLNVLGINCEKIKEVKKVHDNFNNVDNYVIELSDETIELNTNFELERFSNNSPMKPSINTVIKGFNSINRLDDESINPINDESKVEKVIAKIKKSLDVVNNYELVKNESFDQDTWILVWEKKMDNGAINPYESVKLFINKNTGAIQTFKVFNEKPNILTNKISSSDAIKISNDIMTKYGDVSKIKTNLEVVKPNNYWNEGKYKLQNCVKLAWVVADGVINVYVDAVTGEVLGGDQAKSDHAKAFGTYAVDCTDECVDEAYDGLVKLGYVVEPHYTSCSDMRDDILNYLNKDTSYGFYITCHGTNYTLGDNKNWTIYTSDITGNFHLVFLDACYTGLDHTWASAFKCDYPKRGFLGWKTGVRSSDAAQFDSYFWSHVGSKAICSVAIDAAASVPGKGTTPIVFFGDRSWYGYAY